MQQNEAMQPKIALHRLAEYMVTSSPSKRKSIIREQKQAHPRPWYREVRTAVASYLHDNRTETVEEALSDMLERLAQERNRREHGRLSDCCGALEAVVQNRDIYSLNKTSSVLLAQTNTPCTLGGIRISLRPEVAYVADGRHGAEAGVAKLHISKRMALSSQLAEWMATVLYYWATERVPGEASVAPPRCLVFDVFAGSVYNGPSAYKRRLTELTDACQEIARLWPTV